MLHKNIEKFIKSVRKTDFVGNQAVMNNFPKGCCKVASFFLAKYLVLKGNFNENEIYFCVNRRKGESSHAWIEIDDKIIIDLTYSQFGFPEKYVFEIDSDFHLLFEGQNKVNYLTGLDFEENYKESFNKNMNQLLKNIAP